MGLIYLLLAALLILLKVSVIRSFGRNVRYARVRSDWGTPTGFRPAAPFRPPD